jgi:DNA-directed RNA polymerase subunit H (RpoH/RPB5)
MNLGEEVYKSFITIREMLQDRGVNIEALCAYSFDEIKQLSSMRSIFNVDIGSEIRIVWNNNLKFKFSDVRKLIDPTDVKFNTYILVTKEKLSSANMKQIIELGDGVNVFEISELLFNISKHILVPKHELVVDDETIQKILSDYGLKNRHQLPLITRNDPMARYLGLRSGQLVRVTRTSPAAGEYILYRCCV